MYTKKKSYIKKALSLIFCFDDDDDDGQVHEKKLLLGSLVGF